MGRTRRKPKTKDHPRPPQQPQPSKEALLSNADTLVAQCEYDLALECIHRVLEIDALNVRAREIKGIILIESGDLDGARETFSSLIPPHPSASQPALPPASAYLYLAQLSEADPHGALSYYKSAIEILQSQIKGKAKSADTTVGDEDPEAQLRADIVRALVAMVEIWMDPSYDLCFDPAAEKMCEDLLATALKTDPGNSEALQALASVRMSQQRPDDAKACLEEAWKRWKDLDLDDPRIPPLPTRLALVRLFLELELYAPALVVLHGVMASDDQEVEAWYLEGWCFFLMAEKARINGGKLAGETESGEQEGMGWEELARDARDCLETCEMLHTNQEYPDAPLLEHVRELVVSLEGMGIKRSSPNHADEEGDVEQGWDDVDSVDGEDVDMQ